MDLRNDVVPVLQETWAEFQKDNAANLGAALAYYAVFSIFPLLILTLAIFGFVLGNNFDVQQQILGATSQAFSPQFSETLGSILEVVKDQAGAASAVGLITLLLGASGVFQQLDSAFNIIWNVPPKQGGSIIDTVKSLITDKLLAFSMVLSIGFLLLVSMALTGVTQAVLQGATGLLGLGEESTVAAVFGFLLSLVVTLLLNTFIFAMLFKFLPNTKILWSDVWVGAGVTAVLWEVGKRILAWYIGRQSASLGAYGAIGTLLILMLWIYFSTQILFLGAEFTNVYAKRHGSRSPNAPEPITDEATAQEGPQPDFAPAPQPALITRRPVIAAAGLLVGALSGILVTAGALVFGVTRAANSVTTAARRVLRRG